jgi:hypothetical protein
VCRQSQTSQDYVKLKGSGNFPFSAYDLQGRVEREVSNPLLPVTGGS